MWMAMTSPYADPNPGPITSVLTTVTAPTLRSSTLRVSRSLAGVPSGGTHTGPATMCFHRRGPTSEFLYFMYTRPSSCTSLRHDPMVVRHQHSGIFCPCHVTDSVRCG